MTAAIVLQGPAYTEHRCHGCGRLLAREREGVLDIRHNGLTMRLALAAGKLTVYCPRCGMARILGKVLPPAP